jgi:hypothetical protein
MWCVDTTQMCRKHLLGEHVELHMLVGSILKGRNLDGFVENNLIDTKQIIKRHHELVAEMFRRGFKHKSELKQFVNINQGSVDSKANKIELMRRCSECFKR